jgi:hypothetical protein
MGSKTVPERVTAGSLVYARTFDRPFNGILEVLLRDMVTAPLPGARIGSPFGRGENVLPSSGELGVRIFSFESKRQVNASGSVGQIAFMYLPYVLKMQLQWLAQRFRQDCYAIA